MAPSPLKLHSLDDVLQMFPVNIRPTRKLLEEEADRYGCYREVFGKKAFTDADIEELLECMRAKPTAAASLAKLGPGRLFALDMPKNTTGYMVIIGDQLGEDATLFVGWCPDGAAGDLLRLVQLGNPGNLAILHFFPATPADVDAHRKVLRQWQYRQDDTNWYMRSNFVNAYIQKLRAQSYGEQPTEPEANEGDDNGTA